MTQEETQTRRKSRLGAADQGLVDRCVGKVEVIEVFGERQLGRRDLVLDRAGLLLGDLGGEQVADDGDEDAELTIWILRLWRHPDVRAISARLGRMRASPIDRAPE